MLGQLIAETALDEQRAPCGSASATPRSPSASPAIRISAASTASSTATASSRSSGKPASPRPLCRGAAARDPAPADRAQHRRRLPRAGTAQTAINRYQNEERTIEYVALGSGAGRRHPGADAGGARQVFRERKVVFRAPEYRKITLVSMTPDDLAKPDEVTDADAKTYYEQHKARYGTPERREVQQIVFPKRRRGGGRAATHRQGRDLRRARHRARPERHRHRSRPGDQGRRSSTRRSPTPPSRSSRAKSARRSRPLRHRDPASRQDRAGKPEDLRGGGAADQARARGEPRQDRARQPARQDRGRARRRRDARRDRQEARPSTPAPSTRSTAPAAAPTASRSPTCRKPDVVAAAFATDVGVENDPLQLPDGGYLWYDVAGITPSRDRTLDEVKDKVEARWRDDEIAQAPAGQGRRHARQAQGRHRADAARGRVGFKVGRPRPACSAASRAASRRPAGRGRLPDAEGRAGAAPKATSRPSASCSA